MKEGSRRPRKRTAVNASTDGNGTTLGFEAKLWSAADLLRGHLDPGEYKHVVLGLVFLKYISDAFDTRRAELERERGEGADPEDPDEYRAVNVFWVPPKARWARLAEHARQPEIGALVDEAMDAIEDHNSTLKGVLAKDYGRPQLDKRRLGQLIDLVSSIGFGSSQEAARDVLGRVYEYFLGQFASREGKKGGEFYTPRSVVRLLVEMIEPYKGRVYDPCCGSSGMFVQSEEFIRAHGGRLRDISIYGQESNPTTWRLAKMNLAIRGIEANLGPHAADSFHQDLHPDLRADFILANPPFNMSDWGQESLRDDVRWKYGAPPPGNANFAWVQHIIHHLSPTGVAGFVLANGSMSSKQSGEGEIRKRIVEADLVDCIVALPPQLFYGAQVPVCLWFLTRDKSALQAGQSSFRDRHGTTLFIDASRAGVMRDRTHRELTAGDIERITSAYHSWRGAGGFVAVRGFAAEGSLAQIAEQDHVLTPSRYVGLEESVEGESARAVVARLTPVLTEQLKRSEELGGLIREQLSRVDA